MNAEEAKKLALATKQSITEGVKNRIDKTHEDNVALLYKHLMGKVEDAVKEGKLSTESIQFDQSRFSHKIIQEVADLLTSEGFTLNKAEHNAYQKVIFVVSWA